MGPLLVRTQPLGVVTYVMGRPHVIRTQFHRASVRGPYESGLLHALTVPLLRILSGETLSVHWFMKKASPTFLVVAVGSGVLPR